MALTQEKILIAAAKANLIGSDAASRIRREMRKNGAKAVEMIAAEERLPPVSIYRAVAKVHGLEFVDVSNAIPEESLLRRFPRMLMERKQVFPLSRDDEGVRVATADPEDRSTLDALARTLKRPVRFVLAEPQALQEMIGRILGRLDGASPGTTVYLSRASRNPVAFLEELLKEAYLRRASDVHLEPQEHGLRVRFRVDGCLSPYREQVPGELAGPVLSRVKVLAGLDIAESRKPQDGGFTFEVSGSVAIRKPGRVVDIRVATAPTRHGERATLRLLGANTEDLTLEALGFSEMMLEVFREAIRRPYGLVLLTGPTGSGKTTTLYAALREINSPGLNILTVEDPIEYPISGISQMQVDTVGKVGFTSALRALLRHDPDVLMIGEIRDPDTAEIAVRAALTGHLVFSTLHTNTALDAVTRLADMGVPPYLVASTLALAIAQRLIRRLCPECRRPVSVSGEALGMLGIQDQSATLFEAQGCVHCMETGYRGRVGVFESFRANERVRTVLARGAPERELINAGGIEAFTPLRADVARKVLQGLSSLEEGASVLVRES